MVWWHKEAAMWSFDIFCDVNLYKNEWPVVIQGTAMLV